MKYSIAVYTTTHSWETICYLPVDTNRERAEYLVRAIYWYCDEFKDAVLMDEGTGEILYSAADD